MLRRGATLQHIAENLGVSVNTVSRALNGKDGVGEATRERVHAEAERIGYVPNAHARSLVLGTRMLIGLVITIPSNPFYANLIGAVERHARAAGFSVLLLATDELPEREEEAADAVFRSGLDGVIVVPVESQRHPWTRAHRAGLPIVMVNRRLDDIDTDVVRTDNYTGMYNATRHIIEQGASSPVLLEEDMPISTIQDRIDGYVDAMNDAGLSITEHAITHVPVRANNQSPLPWHADGAYRITMDLLDRGHRPDAFLTGNDFFALGTMRALHRRGVKVPDDTAVVGWGDYPFSESLTPSLSTMRPPSQLVGQKAVELLLRQIRNQTSQEPEEHTMAMELVVRESSRAGAPSHVY